MTPATEPQPADTVASLTRDDVQHLVLYFGVRLPPPIGDTADDRARRDNVALGQVASLRPANAEEMWLAARYVAAGAQADDQLRLALLHAANFERTRQINAQYSLMVRTANAARSVLLRVQTARRRLEADEAARVQGAVLAAGLLALLLGTRAAMGGRIEVEAGAVAEAATAEAAKDTAVAEAKAAGAKAAGAKAAALRGGQRPGWEAAPLEPPAPLTEEAQRLEKWAIAADRFATIFPMRTRLIRKFGKLPDDCGIEQPEPELLEAIRIGTKYSLRRADELSKAEVYFEAGNDRHLCQYEDVDEAVVDEPVSSG
jgi:hypothetical protein